MRGRLLGSAVLVAAALGSAADAQQQVPRVAEVGGPAAMSPLAAGSRTPHAPQEVRTESEVVAQVRAANLALRATRAGASADAERPNQVRWPFPMVELMPMPGMLLDGDVGAQVMARQAIPWPARLGADRAARSSMAEASALDAAAVELELVRSARMAYAELWGLQEQASLLGVYVRQLELYREAALAQYAAGRGPQQAVLGIQVEAEILTQRLSSLAEDRSALVARLEALMGGQARIDPDRPLTPPAPVLVGDRASYRDDLATHPMIEAGRAMQAAEVSMAAMSRTMLRPDFTVGVNLNLSRMAFDRMYGQEPVMPSLGVMVPLWRGGVRAQVREAELRATRRELETADARISLETELEDVLTQLSGVQGRIARYEERLRPQVRQTLDASLAGYQAGTTRFLELLDAQRMALDVEMDLIMARVREAQLAARLDASTGRLFRRGETDR
jgi:outer membrane protein, heavy metal efflux system